MTLDSERRSFRFSACSFNSLGELGGPGTLGLEESPWVTWSPNLQLILELGRPSLPNLLFRGEGTTTTQYVYTFVFTRKAEHARESLRAASPPIGG